MLAEEIILTNLKTYQLMNTSTIWVALNMATWRPPRITRLLALL